MLFDDSGFYGPLLSRAALRGLRDVLTLWPLQLIGLWLDAEHRFEK